MLETFTLLLLAAIFAMARTSYFDFAPALAGIPGELADKKRERKAWEDLLMFKKDGGDAPEPDPRIIEAALKQGKIGSQWLDFAKEVYGYSKDRAKMHDQRSDEIVQKQLEAMIKQSDWAQEDRDVAQTWNTENRWRAEDIYKDSRANAAAAREKGQQYEGQFNEQARKQYQFADEQQQRYKDTFRPIEDRIASDAMSWDSAERQAEMAAQARGDVINNASMAQQQQNRQLTAMGVDPRSGRYNATNRAAGLSTALAAAGAQNTARDTVRSQAQQLRGGAASIGQQVNQSGQQANQLGMQATGSAHQSALAGDQAAMQWNNLGMAARGIGATTSAIGTGAQAYNGISSGVNAGTSAMNTTLGVNNAWMNNQNIMNTGYAGAMQGYAGMANGLNGVYQNQMQAYGAEQNANAGMWSGIGSMVGSGASLYALGAFSSKKVKEEKRPITGALEAIEKMPVEKWKYKDGVADSGEHIGPYAEDFKEATGAGDGTMIPFQDAIGVTMKAVQELNQKVDKIAGKKNVMAGGIA